MGTWGVDLFDSDTAQEWLAELEDDEGEVGRNIVTVVSAVLDDPDDPPAFVELEWEPVEVLVAAELLAAAAGWPRADSPREIREWAPEPGTPPAGLLAAARRAVEVVTAPAWAIYLNRVDEHATPGERRLWDEQIADLRTRLDAAACEPRAPARVRRRRPRERDRFAPGDVIEAFSRHEHRVYVQVVAFDRETYGWIIRVTPGAYRRRPADLAALFDDPGVRVANSMLDNGVGWKPFRVVANVPSPEDVEPLSRDDPGFRDLIDRAVGWVAGDGREDVRD